VAGITTGPLQAACDLVKSDAHRSHALCSGPGGKRSRIARRTVTSATGLILSPCRQRHAASGRRHLCISGANVEKWIPGEAQDSTLPSARTRAMLRCRSGFPHLLQDLTPEAQTRTQRASRDT
jgi:hypothetical protein